MIQSLRLKQYFRDGETTPYKQRMEMYISRDWYEVPIVKVTEKVEVVEKTIEENLPTKIEDERQVEAVTDPVPAKIDSNGFPIK